MIVDIQSLVASLRAIPVEHDAEDVSVHQSLVIKELLRWIDDWEVKEVVNNIFEIDQ